MKNEYFFSLIREKKAIKKIIENQVPKSYENKDAIIQDIYVFLGSIFTHATENAKNRDFFYEIKYPKDQRLYEQILKQINCHDYKIETVIRPRYKVAMYIFVDKKSWL
jgi:hypothetical protein